MKFKFTTQKFQTEAVKSITDVLLGQPYSENNAYIRDIGKITQQQAQVSDFTEKDDFGFANPRISLDDDDILKNIRHVQSENNIPQSEKLIKNQGRFTLDIEMETGTGKTYVYIKTIFELNKLYGFTKFIIIVPSVAIREGVKKSFEMTMEHFMECYSKKLRFFIYSSKNLHELDAFSSDHNINVIIINSQAFNATGKDQRKIYEEQDNFASRKPIEVVAANRPIIILDEPQKLSGEKTQDSIKKFEPLFSLNFSATHKEKHNVIYSLDALDAYNKKLVKKIEVKGFELQNLKGTNGYLYLDNIKLSPNEPPKARIELEVKYNNGIKRESRIIKINDNLYGLSNQLEQYKNNYVISEINPYSNSVTFLNGEIIVKGQINGDPSDQNMKRIQIRETILSHIEKEEKLFKKGIKTLSLFFIDEVAKYRVYDENGNQTNGIYGKIFEEEYNEIVKEITHSNDSEYSKHLKSIPVELTHKGYFSIDKKSERMINPETNKKTGESDDISAYDLILKHKELLLNITQPTRFIFSHSALREGWDNPNIFQICTLKHSESYISKRQEVGRGLRLAVNQNGDRIDSSYGEIFNDINKLTVIASESYETFASTLQNELADALANRPIKASVEYFTGKIVIINGEKIEINEKQANAIQRYLIKNDYIDNDDNVTDKYKEDAKNNTLHALPAELMPLTENVHTLIQSLFDVKTIIEDGQKTKIPNPLNDNFFKKEFQTMWNTINHKYAYTVKFNSEELIEKATEYINKNLYVTELRVKITIAQQKENIKIDELEKGNAFETATTKNEKLSKNTIIQMKYDLIGKIAEKTKLTRKTTAMILKKLEDDKFNMFKTNPEEFLTKVSNMINEQKATMVVDHIAYRQIDGKFDNDIFTANNIDRNKAIEMKKHIQKYVILDGISQQSVESRFAQDMEKEKIVNVYAKLPKGFHIPTPMGNYSPDWAIVFHEKDVKHIYFIAETKGSMSSMELRPIEDKKIQCAEKLFNKLSTDKLKYLKITDFKTLINIVTQE